MSPWSIRLWSTSASSGKGKGPPPGVPPPHPPHPEQSQKENPLGTATSTLAADAGGDLTEKLVANDITKEGVLILDTAADVLAATVGVKIKAVKMVGTAAGQATLGPNGASVGQIEMSVPANGSDVFVLPQPIRWAGLKLIAISASCRVYVYTE